MAEKKLNSNLQKAKTVKADEFYTQLNDIEKELKHYQSHFKDKVVYCNCDNVKTSMFVQYFIKNATEFGLKRLLVSEYVNQQQYLYGPSIRVRVPLMAVYTPADGLAITELSGNGGFRSPECIELLKQADVVVTNPPFSLFREYVDQLVTHKKSFIIMGSVNAISYNETFKLIHESKLWLGVSNGAKFFRIPKSYLKNDSQSRKKDENGNGVAHVGICWYTNLDHGKRHEDLILYRNYNEADYPTYDNYDAINVDKTKEIPMDYAGKMGVPISFMDKYNPEQFEIIALGTVGSIYFSCNKKMEILEGNSKGKFTFNAKGTLYRKYNPETDKKPAFKNCETGELYTSIYARIIIRNKKL